MTFRPTRRHMLASAAASGAAFSTGLYGVASAQDVKRIEQFAPEFDKIIGSSVGLHDHVVRPVEAPTLEPQTSPSAVRTGRYSISPIGISSAP
jgi:hypothetical protein